MTTIISRLYATHESANGALDALKATGARPKDYDLIAAGTAGEADLAKAIRRAGVLPKAAETYAAKIREGAALLVVRAPIGRSVPAIRIMDAAGPIASGVKTEEMLANAAPRDSRTLWEKNLPNLITGTMVFSGGWLKPLTSRDRLMFQTMTGLKPLWNRPSTAKLVTDRPLFTQRFGLPLLTSRRFGGGNVTRGGTISEKVGVPTILR